MINKGDLKAMLKSLGYVESTRKVLEKKYTQYDCSIKVDFSGSGKIIYPENKGMIITRRTTCNFAEPENFVVLECVTRLLDKGYRPEHIELEREWALGHEKKSGYADILVKDEEKKTLFIVECKTAGAEYKKEYNNTLNDGGQLFSYWQQERSCKWLVLYASNYENNRVSYEAESIDCSDDANILVSAKKDSTIKLFKRSHTVEELFNAWDETYEKRFSGDVIFRADSQAYNIGVKPLKKGDLKDFKENDKVVNRFEEILRHNNVSDKENAFNRLIALFICKLVDEIQKSDNDVVDFQYKIGTDTYESLQDRLQRLHKEGMEKFMKEEIFYVPDDYAENLVQQYTGQKRQNMIADLKGTIRILKFYTNNDFAFKDVHNEELFYQNGRILVEVVQLFENYRIIGSKDLQLLGDLFEQLLNKGFKQNEGQFFTPIPITRFVWDCLPLEKIIKTEDQIYFPRIIDYSCGAGHFLTQGFEAINACIKHIDDEYEIDAHWPEKKIYGVEKDYRLARVSKISMFMHGAGDGNIIFGDGLENYVDKNIIENSFDILIANPPYAVKAFKPHLKLKNNSLSILDAISNDGSEIETLFVERISQLVKPEGVVAIILPVSILNKESESFVLARESILKNFKVRAIALFGGKTFGKTGQNTAVLYLEKFEEPPKRLDMVKDSVEAIYEEQDLKDWEDDEIFKGYLEKVNVSFDDYNDFVSKRLDYNEWKTHSYFGIYYEAYIKSSIYKNKIKQKTFSSLDDNKKLDWLNEHFYLFSFAVEIEKLMYFALVYQQNTLIIAAPEGSKEQEKFLGYKWSDRKGQEGYQKISAGGMLNNDSDRYDDETIAGLIRNSYYGKYYSVPSLDKYVYYLRLQDMIDFSNVVFNKALKTTKTRVLKVKKGLVNYRLNEKLFDIGIGDRLLASEVGEDGQYPIYSANVFEEFGRIDELNHKYTDFTKPSIVWGIDGDWMVNVIPANMPFYPTDHCGVLRLRTDKILPEYLAAALKVAGKHERFSRSNRASAQRIKNLVVQIPEKIGDQQKLVNEMSAIDVRISALLKQIDGLENDIQDKFIAKFGDIENDKNKWGYDSLGAVCDVRDGTHDSPEYVYEGGYPLLTSQNFTKGFVDFTNVNMISEKDFSEINKRSKVDKGDIVMPMIGTIGSPVIVDTDEPFAIKNVALIKFSKSKMKAEYIKCILNSEYFKKVVFDANRGGNRKFIALTDLRSMKVLLAPRTMQEDFENEVLAINKKKIVLQEEIKKLSFEKNKLISETFS